MTCTYTAGPEGTFTVLRGVYQTNVVAVGASGGSGRGDSGGAGAQVTAFGLSVRPGSTLYAEVDIGGGSGPVVGGGESDLRFCSITGPRCPAGEPGTTPG